ncbi:MULTISPECIES: TIGR02234 family membrane protein [Streptomyces]|uniref:TIGR02234 family membrane protein n=1 Tax=Streptomyces TaxID=1883 RepID=UPI0004C26190|nr:MULTISPECIES: TIGR02234 family membrane protein [Streptomyces]
MTSPTPAPDTDGAQPGNGTAATARDDGPATASGGAARSRASRVALAVALLAGALGAALALISAGQTWSTSTAGFAQGRVPVSAEGGDVTGLPSALGLVGLAALVAVFAVRRTGRYLVAGLLTLCGAAVAVSALLGADDTGALADQAAEASGLSDSGIGAVDVTAWPYVSAAGGALLVVAGLLALRYGPRWPSMSGSARYERVPLRQRAARPQRVDPDRPEDLWKALDRGEDPTTSGTA